MYLKKGNALVIIIIIAVIVGITALYLIRKNASTNYQNMSNSTPSITSGNSDANLQQDMNTIDSSLNNANSASTSVNQGINDTPVPQPQ